MSVIPKESIKIIAQTTGVNNISDTVAGSMAGDVEYRLREICQEAIKFMKHSKREKLTTEDINNALNLRTSEVLYGFSSTDPIHFKRAAGAKDLFYIEDKELSFDEIISRELPPVPRDTTIKTHWLAVEGVMPAIPQNVSAKYNKKRKREGGENVSDTEVRPIVKHTLSKELQIFYEKITDSIKAYDQTLVDAALNTVRGNTGLNQLLPYFVQFLAQEVTKNLKNRDLLFNLMKLVKSIIDSEHFAVEPYLHQLMPPILTCLVGKRLSNTPEENHWELREYSAKLIAQICKKYGHSYTSLQPRITTTLINALLEPSKPLTTHYGAIVGLTELGFHVVQVLLIPNVATYTKLIDEVLNSGTDLKKKEATKCREALLTAAGMFLKVAKQRKLKNGSQKKINESNLEEDKMEVDEEEILVSKKSQDEKPKSHANEEFKNKLLDSTEMNLDEEYNKLYEIFGDALLPYSTTA